MEVSNVSVPCDTIGGLNEKELDCLCILRNRIEGDDTLVKFMSLMDDRFLLHFVRGRKYDLDKAQNTIIEYIRVRTKYKEIFLSIFPTQNDPQYNCIRLLKNRGPKGQFIVCTAIEWWRPIEEVMSNAPENLIKKSIHVLEELWKDESVEKHGIEIVADVGKVRLIHIKQFGMNSIIKILNIFVGAMPIRYVKLHAIHPPLISKIVLKILKLVAPPKLVNRIQFHDGDLSSLQSRLPKSILPLAFGGELPDDEAYDAEFYQRIISPEKDEHYRKCNEILGLS